ncbi:MAG: hypothetical protein B7Z80_10795 [Rhodospirillales bacterium 20-64-7]|nr:MAG: hypothetical protein B7Z80_10795 [Rhodospirillales bacterium 20-64-7]HQT77040.1 type II secretion system protein GspM [Rhodopila sp.]
MALSLPSGRRGQALALGIAALAGAVLWLGAVAPLLDAYNDRAETLRREQAVSRRMEALVQTLPALRERASAAVGAGHETDALLPGRSDALAAAALQQKLDELAKASGVRLGSQEILPVQASGAFRTIGVRVTLRAPWRSVVGLLQALAQAATPMVVDELSLRGPAATVHDPDLPVDASFTATALRGSVPTPEKASEDAPPAAIVQPPVATRPVTAKPGAKAP